VNVDRQAIRSILVIKLRGIGDVLLSTIVSKNLRLGFPDARIEYLTEPPSAEVLWGNPFLNDIVVFDRATMSGIALINQIRQRSYSMIIDLFGNPRTALLTRLSGAPIRVGFRFRWRTYAYNVVVTPRGALVHNTQFNLDALEAIGVAIQDRNVYFQITPDDETYVDRILEEAGISGRFIVALNMSGGWYTKRWGLDRFAELADRLVDLYGASVILTWGPGQIEEARYVQAKMRNKAVLPPETTLKQLGALMKRCSFLVSNDSGPMHIAAAVGTPVVAIYGPTSPDLQGPFGKGHVIVRNEGLSCLGCNLTKCPIGHPCMLGLSVDAVMKGVESLIENNVIAIDKRAT